MWYVIAFVVLAGGIYYWYKTQSTPDSFATDLENDISAARAKIRETKNEVVAEVTDVTNTVITETAAAINKAKSFGKK